MSDRGTADDRVPVATGSLDPADWTVLRQQAHRMLDDMLGSMEHIREAPVWQPTPDEVRAHFRGESSGKADGAGPDSQ